MGVGVVPVVCSDGSLGWGVLVVQWVIIWSCDQLMWGSGVGSVRLSRGVFERGSGVVGGW